MEMASQYVSIHSGGENTSAYIDFGYPYEESYKPHVNLQWLELKELEKEYDKLERADHNWFEAMKAFGIALIIMNILVLLTDVSLPIGFVPLPFLVYSMIKKKKASDRLFELASGILSKKLFMERSSS